MGLYSDYDDVELITLAVRAEREKENDEKVTQNHTMKLVTLRYWAKNTD